MYIYESHESETNYQVSSLFNKNKKYSHLHKKSLAESAAGSGQYLMI